MLRVLLLVRAAAALHVQPEQPRRTSIPAAACDLSMPIRPWSKSVAQIESELGPCLEATFDRLCIGMLSDVRGGAKLAQGGVPQKTVILHDVFKVLAAHSAMRADRSNCNSENQVHLWLGWVTANMENHEVQEVMEKTANLNAPFMLITPGDLPMPTHGSPLWLQMLQGKFKGTVWTWNPIMVHPQLKTYPLGIYHKNRMSTGFEAENASVAKSSRLAASLGGREASVSNRRSLLACHGIGHEGFCNRGLKIDALEKLGHHCRRKDNLNWTEYIGSMVDSKLAISPAGTVVSNHRDYEVVYSGAVPVYDSQHHPVWSPLKEGFPAIYVENWSELTPAYLEDQWEKIVANPNQYDVKRSFLPFWVDEVLRDARRLEKEGNKKQPAQEAEESEKFVWGNDTLSHAICCNVGGGLDPRWCHRQQQPWSSSSPVTRAAAAAAAVAVVLLVW